jgi:hypothetical protein
MKHTWYAKIKDKHWETLDAEKSMKPSVQLEKTFKMEIPYPQKFVLS